MPRPKYDPEKDIKLSLMPDDSWLKCEIRDLDLFNTFALYYEVQLTTCDRQQEHLISKLLISFQPLTESIWVAPKELGRVLTWELKRYTAVELGRLCRCTGLSPQQRSRLTGELRLALADRLGRRRQELKRP